MATDVMIEAKGLTKRYGSLRALDKVSFEVRRGEVVGFLGPNGAGKSTTMRILTCYLSATSGSAHVHGYDVFDSPLEVRQRLGYLPQRAQMYGEMSVWEYLRFVGELRKLDLGAFKKRMKNVVEVCGLSTVLGKDIRTLSHGYRQRVGLGQALLHDPPILILDEPTSDLDPNEKAEVIDYIKEIGRDRTVVLSTHNLAEVEAACARAIIVSKGRVVADGNIDEVRARGGRVRYQLVIHEKDVLRGKPPTAAEVEDALKALPGITSVKETPTDDRAHAFALLATKSSDLRAEMYRLCVDKGWLLLEMTRDIQRLEDVFKSLTRGEEALSRGHKPPVEDETDDDLDEDEDEDRDEDEDEDREDLDEQDEKPADSSDEEDSDAEEDDSDDDEAAEETDGDDDEEDDDDEDDDDEEDKR